MDRIKQEIALLLRSVITELIALIVAIIVIAIFFKPVFLFWLEYLG